MPRDRLPSAAPPAQEPARSVGLVLGAGGIAGWAWLVGCLAALEEVAGWDARRADLVIGTSAGAGVAATLRGGVSPAEQMARYRAQANPTAPTASPWASDAATSHGDGAPGAPAANAPSASASAPNASSADPAATNAASASASAGPAAPTDAAAAGAISPDPAAPQANRRAGMSLAGRQRPQALQLALLGLGRWPPRPGVALAGLLPRGDHDLDDLAGRLRQLHPGAWSEAPLWITALRADTGTRVVFGRDGVAGADVVTAVRASAAIPGWYEPVRIGTRRYLDGGSWSSTNADLAAGLGFDLALVLAPLSVSTGKLALTSERVRRAYHRSVLSREVDVVHRNGTDTVVVEPHPDDLSLLGGDPREVEPARRLAIAERARERLIERLADDAALMTALGSPAKATP